MVRWNRKTRYPQWKTKWMTAEGEVVRIVDMSDFHLRNTIKLLTTWSEIWLREELNGAFECSIMFDGDMAMDHIDQAIENLIEAQPEDIAYDTFKAYPKMIDEAAKRELTI